MEGLGLANVAVEAMRVIDDGVAWARRKQAEARAEAAKR